MDPDWCLEEREVEVGPDRFETECVDFKNMLEGAKYLHNVRMRNRNRWWLGFMLGVGAIAGIVVFSVIPRLRGLRADPESAPVGAVVGILSALLVPMLLATVLPPPGKWGPAYLREVSRLRVEQAMKDIRRAVAKAARRGAPETSSPDPKDDPRR